MPRLEEHRLVRQHAALEDLRSPAETSAFMQRFFTALHILLLMLHSPKVACRQNVTRNL